jgi:vitamin B12 transporter
LSAGYKSVEDEFLLRPSAAANNNRSKLLQALLVHEHKFGTSTTLSSGVQFQNRKIASNDRGNHHVKQAAGFVVLNQLIGASFHINPAVRVDWDERSGTEFVPQINLSYKADALQFRGSAGKTIRQADFTERFNNYQRTSVPSGNRIGNPDLVAETSFSFEIGADYFASKHLKLSATYFQRNHDDLIDFVLTPYEQMPRKSNLVPSGTYSLARNISEVTTKGFETDIQWSKPISNNQQIYSTLGLIWIDSESSEATPSFYISSHAAFLANYNLSFTTSRVSIGINGIYKRRQQQTLSSINAKVSKDYYIMNVKAEAFVVKNRFSVFAEVDNLFDRKYSDLLGAPMPGRWLIGGIKFSFYKS